jgi:hypothetical protein
MLMNKKAIGRPFGTVLKISLGLGVFSSFSSDGTVAKASSSPVVR